jgi:hypothetical protein
LNVATKFNSLSEASITPSASTSLAICELPARIFLPFRSASDFTGSRLWMLFAGTVPISSSFRSSKRASRPCR